MVLPLQRAQVLSLVGAQKPCSKTKTSPANSDNLSTKIEGKENTFIIEYTLNQKAMHIIGNPLRDCKDRRNLTLLYSQAYSVHCTHALKLN